MAVVVIATATVAMAMPVVDVFSLVVVASFNRRRPQNVVDAVTLWEFVNPLLDCRKHVTMDFAILFPECRMMEDLENILNNLAYWHARVIPCI